MLTGCYPQTRACLIFFWALPHAGRRRLGRQRRPSLPARRRQASAAASKRAAKPAAVAAASPRGARPAGPAVCMPHLRMSLLTCHGRCLRGGPARRAGPAAACLHTCCWPPTLLPAAQSLPVHLPRCRGAAGTAAGSVAAAPPADKNSLKFKPPTRWVGSRAGRARRVRAMLRQPAAGVALNADPPARPATPKKQRQRGRPAHR
jgi:hypothetical protein